jgi:hypothetical protein
MKKCVRIGIYDPPLEECDNGVGCLSNCSCNKIQQYVPTIPPSTDCTKCGNGILDVGEQCDSGISIKKKNHTSKTILEFVCLNWNSC